MSAVALEAAVAALQAAASTIAFGEGSREAKQQKSILIDSFRMKQKEIELLEREGLTGAVCNYSGKLLSKTFASIFNSPKK